MATGAHACAWELSLGSTENAATSGAGSTLRSFSMSVKDGRRETSLTAGRGVHFIQSWIGLLKHDCRAFFTACSRAQAAADYLRGLALRDQPAIAA